MNMRRTITQHRTHGFTLLELLVAMFIAAIMFAMGYGTINQAVNNRGALQEQQNRLVELQTTMRILEQDFTQMAPRMIREPIGTGWIPALSAQPSGQQSAGSSSSSSSSSSTSSSSSGLGSSPPLLTLTRYGWTNPTGQQQRSTMQRVAYFFDKGTLRREYWTVLDATQSNTTLKRDLATHLKSVTFRYMDQGRVWQTTWPLQSTANNGSNNEAWLRSRPMVVEVTLETEDWGKLVRTFEVAG